MNIETIREARKEAERQILEVLSSFKAATGLHITGIGVHEVRAQQLLCQERPGVLSQRVTVTLEQI